MSRLACFQSATATLALALAIPATAQTPGAPSSPPPPPVPSMGERIPGAHGAKPPLMGPVLTPDPVIDAASYGPPMPKAAHGQLAQVDWPRAPALVPPGLESAINIVTRTYPTTGSARAALRAAASDLRSARLQWLPSLSGNVAAYTGTRTLFPQLVIDQPVFTGGRIGSGIRRARAGEDASSAQYADTVHELALTTTQTYFDIVRLTQREQLLVASLREHRRLVDTIDRRVTQEVAPLADLQLARSRTAQVEQDLNSTHAARLTSLRIMAQLVADAGYDVGPVPYYDPTIELFAPDALEEQAAVYSPQLRRLRAAVDVARADLDSRRAAVLPQIGAQYSYDQFYGHRVGAVISAQNSASQIPDIQAARVRITEAEDNRRSSEVQLRREVATDLIEFQAARSRAQVSHDAAVTAVAVSESFMRQYIAGRRSWLDVMNQLREAVSAQISETEAETSVMATATRLTIESGRWRPKFDVTAP